MAVVRIRGRWTLNFSSYEGMPQPVVHALADGVLEISKATRTSLEGEIRIGGERAPVVGKLKPGSPAVVTLTEADEQGQPLDDGLEAMLYIPPWWPNIDYSYDYITGTMVIGHQSRMESKSLRSSLISVAGVQPFE